MIQITVGKKRTATFIPVDQFGNPNPVGADGQPLDVVGIPAWRLLPAEGRSTRLADPMEAATIVPSEDGRSCDVIAVEENRSLGLEVSADTAEGTRVRGGSSFETVGVAGPVSVIASLGISWSEEKDV
jgi:hypothetical protein